MSDKMTFKIGNTGSMPPVKPNNHQSQNTAPKTNNTPQQNNNQFNQQRNMQGGMPPAPNNTGRPPQQPFAQQPMQQHPQQPQMGQPMQQPYQQSAGPQANPNQAAFSNDWNTPDPKQEAQKKQRAAKKKERKTKKKEKESKPISVQEQYSNYKRRKRLVLIAMIAFLVVITVFGLYNTFFKKTLTVSEAIAATNKYNGQTRAQSWDSGVNGFLQTNLYNLLNAKFNINTNAKEFTVDNITVERNWPIDDETFITFFSADITINGQVNRMFMILPVSISNGEFAVAGELEITSRKSYTANSTNKVENPLLEFNKQGVDEKKSKELESQLTNFFTLGYNNKQDVSSIYKGEAELNFEGKFISITNCLYYKESGQNGLEFNAYVEYMLQLNNGGQFRTSAMLKVHEDSSGNFIIDQIL